MWRKWKLLILHHTNLENYQNKHEIASFQRAIRALYHLWSVPTMILGCPGNKISGYHSCLGFNRTVFSTTTNPVVELPLSGVKWLHLWRYSKLLTFLFRNNELDWCMLWWKFQWWYFCVMWTVFLIYDFSFYILFCKPPWGPLFLEMLSRYVYVIHSTFFLNSKETLSPFTLAKVPALNCQGFLLSDSLENPIELY